jgi:hypothetical protein
MLFLCFFRVVSLFFSCCLYVFTRFALQRYKKNPTYASTHDIFFRKVYMKSKKSLYEKQKFLYMKQKSLYEKQKFLYMKQKILKDLTKSSPSHTLNLGLDNNR